MDVLTGVRNLRNIISADIELMSSPVKPQSRFLPLFLIIFVTAALVSCSASRGEMPWVYADLRLLDDLDGDISPAADILAVYTRLTTAALEIRVDLLDITPQDDYEITITLRDDRFYSRDPLIIIIPSRGLAHASSFASGAPSFLPDVIRDPWLDTVTVRLNRFEMGSQFHFDLTTYAGMPLKLADQVLDIQSGNSAQGSRVPVMLAFWNVFTATSPMQALRQWDGAHSGPLGERHGLKHLLDASLKYKVPLALLDIKTPSSLAALNTVGGIAICKDLIEQGLVILPEFTNGDPTGMALALNRKAEQGFGVPSSTFLFDPSGEAGDGFQVHFTTLSDPNHIGIFDSKRYIPLPQSSEMQATSSGPAMELRRTLVNTVSRGDASLIISLGGDFPNSTWGNSDSAAKTLGWLSAHPWIWLLSDSELVEFPGKPMQPSNPSGEGGAPSLLAALGGAPANTASESAWLTTFVLSSPTNNEKLQSLRSVSSGQVGELLAASRWAAAPFHGINCSDDMDGDYEPECILADSEYFAIVDPVGARLTNLFFLDRSGPHQIVGPTSQFAVGLSDSSQWNMGFGEAADPGAISGAFEDGRGPWALYDFLISEQEIVFTSPDESIRKIYRLTVDGLAVEYRASAPVSIRIPLVVDPQKFFFQPSAYIVTQTSDSLTWGPEEGISAKISSNVNISAVNYTEALSFLTRPENPDKEYPAGSYLPFPLAVATIQGQEFWVKLSNK
jgi:hypothetical protein